MWDGEGAVTVDKLNCVPIMLISDNLALMAKFPAKLLKCFTYCGRMQVERV